MNGYSYYGNKQMRMGRFVVIQTGSYQDQVLRPFETEMSQFTRNNIVETVLSSRQVSPQALAPLLTDFIKPSAVAESDVQIPGGFRQQRIRFYLEIVMEDQIGSKSSQMFIGYTDHFGVSMQSGALDPNMVFYLNGSTRIRTMPSLVGQNGSYQSSNMIESSLILPPPAREYQGLAGGAKTFLMRPEDVFSQIDNQFLKSGAEEDDTFYDGRTIMTNQARKSKREFNSGSAFVAGMLDSWHQTARGAASEDEEEIIDNSRTLVAADQLNRDHFISWLMSTSHGRNSGNYFTLSDLDRLDPTASARVNEAFTRMLEDYSFSDPWRGVVESSQSEYWRGQDGATIWATVLAQSVPGYMMEAGLTKVAFHVTNDTIGARVVMTLSGAKSLNMGASLEQNSDRFKFVLEHQLLKMLSGDNEVCYSIKGVIDTMGDTILDVSLNQAPETRFVWPTYMDALMPPVVTTYENRLDQMAESLGSIIKDVQVEQATAKYGGGLNLETIASYPSVGDWGSSASDDTTFSVSSNTGNRGF